jgi:hypothetical protein
MDDSVFLGRSSARLSSAVVAVYPPVKSLQWREHGNLELATAVRLVRPWRDPYHPPAHGLLFQ